MKIRMHRFTFFHSFSLIVSLDFMVILDIIVFSVVQCLVFIFGFPYILGGTTEEVTIQKCALMRKCDVF
jgi:hypothetical protein